MRVAFLVGDIAGISGGSNVIVEHAMGLAALGADVTLVTTWYGPVPREPWHHGLRRLRVLPLAAAAREQFRFAFATWWMTWFDLWRIQADAYGYLNQSLESRFHPDQRHKALCRATYSLPLLFVTEARWLAELIGRVRPDATVLHVPNGLSRSSFPRAGAVQPRSGTLRVLIEGPWDVPFKGVPETFAVVDEAARRTPLEVGWLASTAAGARPRIRGAPVEIHEAVPMDRVREVYGRYDVLVKLSRVEGVFGPPLEMFSQGGTAITYAVTGANEYMVHGWNGLVVEPFNRALVPRYLDALQRRPEWLASLRANALETARAYPGWEEQTGLLAGMLGRLDMAGYRNDALRPALRAAAAATRRELERARAGWLASVLPPRLACAVRASTAYDAAKRVVPAGLRARVRRALSRGET